MNGAAPLAEGGGLPINGQTFCLAGLALKFRQIKRLNGILKALGPFGFGERQLF